MLFPYVREREKLSFLPLLLDPGNFLLSQAVPSSVPSAFGGLTSVFGMGTGVSIMLSLPDSSCQVSSGHSKPDSSFSSFKLACLFGQALDLLVSVR